MGHVILSWNMEVKQKRFWAETIFKLRQGAYSTRFVGRSVGKRVLYKCYAVGSVYMLLVLL